MNANSELPYQIFRVTSTIAREKDIPIVFKAVIIRETAKAVFLEGKGMIDPRGTCSKCGRELTHPGSILIGIGPECIGSWANRKIALDNMTEADVTYLRSLVEEREVKSWFPKSLIKNWHEIDTTKVVEVKKEEVKKEAVEKKAVKKASLYNDSQIRIQFDFNYDTLEQVKSLSKRSYNSSEKIWYAAVTFDNIKKLKSFGFDLSKELNTIIANEFEIKNAKNNVEITGLKKTLMPFQEVGVNFLINRNGRAIIGDEMGLGKTVQALGYIHHSKERPAIIVCPASLKGNWKNEVEAWIPNAKVNVISSGKNTKLTKDEDIVIINYDILSKWKDEIKKIEPKIIVLDESHSIKNSKALRTKAAMSIAKKIPHVIALSGTPAINRPAELFNSIRLIEPKLFANFYEFGMKYCGATHNGYGWNFNGSSNLSELYEILKNVMIRRKKIDVLSDLPEKRFSFVPIELTNEKEYRDAENDIINYIKQTKGRLAASKAESAETLVKIANLRRLAAKGSLANSFDWIDNFIEGSDQKLVIFANHREIIDEVVNRYKDMAVKIDGSVKPELRTDIVNRFQHDDSIRIFVGNIKAAGVGLTLTAASNVVFLELPWTPGELSQAEDRCHRIGQKNSVNIWYLLPKNTIEETLAKMIDSKRKVLAEVLDGETSPKTDNMISELINDIVNELADNFFKEEN